jgi:hypothetical protein
MEMLEKWPSGRPSIPASIPAGSRRKVASESGGKRAWLGRVQGHFAAILRMVIRPCAMQKNFAKVFQKHASAKKFYCESSIGK